MKVILSFLLSVTVMYGYTQNKILQLQSYDEYGGHDANIFIGNNAFLVRSSTSLLKTKNSNVLMEYKELSPNKCLAVWTKATEYSANEKFFTYMGQKAEGDTIIKADTVYYKADTIINGFKCKKIGINYLRTTQYNIQNEKQPIAVDIHTFIWICPSININTPFSFHSKKASGFIIKYQENRPPFADTSGFMFKKVHQANLSPWIFQLPPAYDLCDSRDAYEQRIANFMYNDAKN